MPKESEAGSNVETPQKTMKKNTVLATTRNTMGHVIRKDDIKIFTLAMITSIVKTNEPSTQIPPNIPGVLGEIRSIV